MNEQPFVPGKSYWFKQTTRLAAGSMVDLRHAVDVNSLAHKPAGQLGLNEVGRVTLALSTPLVFDPYAANPATGAFIIIDRLSNTTVGAGMILGRPEGAGQAKGRVMQQEKDTRLGQRGAAVWVARSLTDRLERALFAERSLTGAAAVADRLDADVARLQQRVATETYDATDLANGASELLSEVGPQA